VKNGRVGPPPEVDQATLQWLGVQGSLQHHQFTKATTFAAHHPRAYEVLPTWIQEALPFVPYDLEDDDDTGNDGQDGEQQRSGGHGSLVTHSFVKLVQKQCLEGSIAEVATQFADVHHQAYHKNELLRLKLELRVHDLVCPLT
jgi:hypothetical protein